MKFKNITFYTLLFSLFFGIWAFWRLPLELASETYFIIIVMLGVGHYIKNNWVKMFYWTFMSYSMFFNTGHKMLACFNVFIAILFYIFLVEKIKYKDINSIFNIVCLVALVNAIYCYVQHLGYDKLFNPEIGNTQVVDFNKKVIHGFMYNPNHLAALIGMALPCFFRRRWFWFIPLVVSPLFLSNNSICHTRQGIVLCLVVIVIMFMVYNKKWRYINKGYMWSIFILTILSGILYFYKVGFNLGFRYEYWIKTIQFMFNHPIGIGFGFGAGSFALMRPIESILCELHNEPLQILFEGGILPFLALIGFTVQQTIRFVRTKKSEVVYIVYCGLLGVLLISFVSFPFHRIGLLVLCLIYISLSETIQKEEVK